MSGRRDRRNRKKPKMTGDRRIPVRRAATTSAWATDLTWELWHGEQQVPIAECASAPRAGHSQDLRVPDTLQLTDPARPQLVQIIEDLTSERIYTAAEIGRSCRAPPLCAAGSATRWHACSATSQAPNCTLPSILAAFRSIGARLQETGPFIAQGDRPGDSPIPVDWSGRDCWKEMAPLLRSGMTPPGDGIAAPWGLRVREAATSGRPRRVVFLDSGNAP
jgi:hypothetical protein